MRERVEFILLLIRFNGIARRNGVLERICILPHQLSLPYFLSFQNHEDSPWLSMKRIANAGATEVRMTTVFGIGGPAGPAHQTASDSSAWVWQ